MSLCVTVVRVAMFYSLCFGRFRPSPASCARFGSAQTVRETTDAARFGSAQTVRDRTVGM